MVKTLPLLGSAPLLHVEAVCAEVAAHLVGVKIFFATRKYFCRTWTGQTPGWAAVAGTSLGVAAPLLATLSVSVPGCVAGVAAPLVSLERPLEGSTAWRGGRITPILRPGAGAWDLALEGVGVGIVTFNSHNINEYQYFITAAAP